MGRKRILVITSSVDETVSYIISRYSNIVDFFRVNVDDFGKYSFRIDNNGRCEIFSVNSDLL